MSDNLAYQEEFWEEMIGGKVVAMSPRPSTTTGWRAEYIGCLKPI